VLNKARLVSLEGVQATEGEDIDKILDYSGCKEPSSMAK